MSETLVPDLSEIGGLPMCFLCLFLVFVFQHLSLCKCVCVCLYLVYCFKLPFHPKVFIPSLCCCKSQRINLLSIFPSGVSLIIIQNEHVQKQTTHNIILFNIVNKTRLITMKSKSDYVQFVLLQLLLMLLLCFLLLQLFIRGQLWSIKVYLILIEANYCCYSIVQYSIFPIQYKIYKYCRHSNTSCHLVP